MTHICKVCVRACTSLLCLVRVEFHAFVMGLSLSIVSYRSQVGSEFTVLFWQLLEFPLLKKIRGTVFNQSIATYQLLMKSSTGASEGQQ